MFDQIVEFARANPILSAFYASVFTWGLTALGAALVFFFKKANRAVLDGMLGFTGGVMIAASFWSLLSPAIENSKGEGFYYLCNSLINSHAHFVNLLHLHNSKGEGFYYIAYV